MKKNAGVIIGVVYLLIAMGAFKKSIAGWEGAHGDLGFWWAVIGVLLFIAGLGALLGTYIHAWTHHDGSVDAH